MLSQKQSQILEELRSKHLSRHLKLAGPDVKKTFEENFFQLVDAIMDEHFPRLKKYDLGFQLIDKSPDNTKAFGVRALRLRSLAFIPFFYNNGTVGGYEILFLPRLNLFLPASESWTVYLTSRTKDELGGQDVGLKDHYQKLYPNLMPLRRPVTFKQASLSRHLPDFIVKYSTVAKRLCVFIDRCPWLLEKMAKFYGPEIFSLIKESLKKDVPTPRYVRDIPAIEKQAKLRIYHEFQDPIVYSELTVKEREELFNKGYFIKDARDDSEVSQAIPLFRKDAVFEVDSPGYYEVLSADFKKHKATVFYLNGRLSAVIDDEPRVRTIRHLSFIHYPMESPDTITLYATRKLGEFVDSPQVEKGNITELMKKPGVTIFDRFGVGWQFITRGLGFCNDEALVSDSDHLRVVEMPRSRSARKVKVLVPRTCYILKNLEAGNSKEEDKRSPFISFDISLLESPRLSEDVENVKVSFSTENGYYYINNHHYSKFEALTTLMRDYNLRESDAIKILRDAELNKTARYLIKSAQPFHIRQSENPSVYFPEAPRGEWPGGYPFESKLEAVVWVPGLKRPQPIVNILEPPPLKVIQKIKQLADANDGEAFDLAMISSLLYTTNLDDYIPVVIKGIDALCRILFIFYKHQDEIIDRYGKEDYKRILENLKSSIEIVGDLVIDLSQKKIDPYINVIESETQNIQEV